MGNTIFGANGITVRQGIYEQSASQKCELGRRLEFEDGRVFRYAKAGATALTKAYMTISPPLVANHKDVVQTGYGITAGQKEVNVLLTTTVPTANQYDEGTLLCGKGTGLGQIYRIRKHTLAIAPCIVTLYDEVITTIAATAELTLTANKYLNVVVAPTTPLGVFVGIPLITVTAYYYFWAQTRGYAPFVADSTITTAFVLGEPVGDGETMTVPGAGDGLENQNNAAYGLCVQIPEASEVGIIDLHLE